MIRNRDKINQAIVSLESKLMSLKNCVERQFPIKDYLQLVEDSDKNVKIIRNNFAVTRNNDILNTEIKRFEQSVAFLREAVQGQHPVEKYITTIERMESNLEAIDQGIQREPIDGYEVSSPGRVN